MNILRRKLHVIVFGTSTKAGRSFDVFLLWTILFSVLVVMLESVPEYGNSYRELFFVVEWIMTGIFTIEYILRIWISPRPLRYIFSFWGIIDLLSIMPTYLSLFFGGYHYLLVVRIFRLLRVFRVFKLARFSSEARILREALKSSLHKVGIFLMVVIAIVVILGTVMYVVEGGEEGFSSIPQSIYWAVVTVTTVGYGDLVPHTVIGKFISSIAMITGYAIIAVPTGIVTVAMARASEKSKICPVCKHDNEKTAAYCNKCGNGLSNYNSPGKEKITK
jgi:voltage-gated potassium channel